MKKRLGIALFAFALLQLPALPASAAARFLVACTSACTWDNSSTLIWSTTSGGASGSAAPTSADVVTLDANSCVGGVTCTITVNANLIVQSLTMGACTASTTGCILDFSANNNNITTGSFSGTGTGTRTLKMGSGIWTINAASGTPWSMLTTTNLTFQANSSTINFNNGSNATITFAGGGLTYNAINFNSGTHLAALGGANTFASLVITAPSRLAFAPGLTTTITAAFTFTGTSSNLITLESSTVGTTATVSVASGTPTLTWGAVQDLTFTGGATFSASNTMNLGNNSGMSITGPTGGGGGGFVGIIGGGI